MLTKSSVSDNSRLVGQIGELTKAPYRSIHRIARDLAFWVAAAAMAETSGQPLAMAVAVAFIGAVPLHDLMVHGHEGVHGLISRNRKVNEFFNWLVHAIVGISASAYRWFHLTHHKTAQTEDDPELAILNIFQKNPPGWSYLFVPFTGYLGFNFYAWKHRTKYATSKTITLDLALAGIMHASFVLLLGWRLYLTYVTLPIVTSLALTNAFRSICEHHGLPRGTAWSNTRGMRTHRWLEWLWSNVNYHLEHHLFPSVPFHKLPEVRRLLEAEYTDRGSTVEDGYWRTALRLFNQRLHIVPATNATPSAPANIGYLVDPSTIAFKLKVMWLKDILQAPAARRYLWSLYFAGEAYVELHPDGVFIPRLQDPYGRLLDRHLTDETRHAGIFRELLAQEGCEPEHLSRKEDLGWFLLNSIVPDIVAKAGEGREFSPEESARYMAFLHTLELRSTSDLYALLTAARQLGQTELVAQLETIIPDEVFHAVYTHRAVMELTKDKVEARRLLDWTRCAELPLYTESASIVIERLVKLNAVPSTLRGFIMWHSMRMLCVLQAAFPLLPLYQTVPHFIAPGEKLRRFVERRNMIPDAVNVASS